jgi:hypothetical protein
MLNILIGIGEFLFDCLCNGGRGKGLDLDDDIKVDDNGEIYGDI